MNLFDSVQEEPATEEPQNQQEAQIQRTNTRKWSSISTFRKKKSITASSGKEAEGDSTSTLYSGSNPVEDIERRSSGTVNSKFRRYSTLKIKDLAVQPCYYEKVRLIGKGDVGRVYLVVDFSSLSTCND